MKRRSLFGNHLYGQIVYPLMAASLVIGLTATLVAVYFLDSLTTSWVVQTAKDTTAGLAQRADHYVSEVEREARMISEIPQLIAALETTDTARQQASLSDISSRRAFDAMMLLDAQGRAVAVAGTDTVGVGASLTPVAAFSSVSSPRLTLGRIGDAVVLTALQPVPSAGEARTLAVSRVVGTDLLEELGVGQNGALCLYDQRGELIACAFGGSLPDQSERGLAPLLMGSSPNIASLLARAREKGSAAGEIAVAGDKYEVWAEKTTLSPAAGSDGVVYLLGTVSHAAASQAGRTTSTLVTLWAAVAVVALVGLGGWVARRVSDPLVELADGARRISEGDFNTKVEAKGSDEIVELAESFNTMTDSLRERSETLTKKVLELATLYEMSRSLGATLDMDELLRSVLDSALRIFDLDLGYVVLRDSETRTLKIRALRDGADDIVPPEDVRSSMSEWVVREGRPLIFNPDTNASGGRIDSVTGAKAALCVPLTSPDGAIGSLTIGSSRDDHRFNSDDVRLLSTIANHVTIAIGNIELFSSLQEAYLATVRSLATAVDAKDSYTRGHSDRVALYSTLIAERLGLAHEQIVALEMAAYLHDIGKIGVPEEILLKPGQLTDTEMAQMRHHPLIGANILKPVAFPWAITPVVRHHHECWDGGGYPAGLRGEEIPLLARILTVADSYEAMTSDRPYRTGMSVERALEELKSCSGAQFDPAIVDVLVAIISEAEDSGAVLERLTVDTIEPSEARAVFAELVDGVLASFRRLGGPRLAANVEAEFNEACADGQLPFCLKDSVLVYSAETPAALGVEVEQMRGALRRLDAIVGRLSGGTLVDHFYEEALSSSPLRVRDIARLLGFYAR